MADNVTTKDAAGVTVPIHTDEVTSINGGAVSAAQVQVIKVATGASGAATYVSGSNEFPVADATARSSLASIASSVASTVTNTATGTFGYAAGTTAANVDVPTGARIKHVSVVSGDTANATVTILGGATITVLAGGALDLEVPGNAVATSSTSEVAIGGTCRAYYVDWIV